MIQKSKSPIIQRILLGILAIVFLCIGLFLALANEGENNSLSGILIRVGLMLAATWLAFPVLQSPDGQHSLFLIGIVIGAILVVAARPRLFIGAAVVLGVTAIANWLLKKASSGIR